MVPWLAELSRLTKVFGRSANSEEAVLTKTLHALRDRLAVKRAEKVFVIEVVITANAPDKAARIANAIADAYLAEEAYAKTQATERASAALKARLAEQRARVEQAAIEVGIYKVSHNILATNGQLVGEQKLAAISTELTAAQALTANLRAKLDVMKQPRKSGTAATATTEALQSSVISKLREQEAVLEQRQADLEARFGPEFPAIAAIRRQLAEINRLVNAELDRLAAAVQTDYNRALSNESLLSIQFEQTRSAVRDVDKASVKLHELERELEANRSVYSAFMARAREIGEQVGIDTTNARVISRALPPLEKSWPSLKVLLAGAIAGGIGLGCGFALLREYVSPTILSRSQVEAMTGARVIGVVPSFMLLARRKRARCSGKETDASPTLLGAIRLAVTRLSDTNAAEGKTHTIRSLMITSGEQDREIRREFCQLLASAAQSMGERVLLVDADLTGTGADEGLREILQGRCTLASVVDVAAASNGVIALGTGRVGLAGLRNKDGCSSASRLLWQAQPHFDLVIIDGGVLAENLAIAPLLTVADDVPTRGAAC